MTGQIITGWRNRKAAEPEQAIWGASPAFNGLNARNAARISAAPKTPISFDPDPKASQARNFAMRKANI